VPESSNVERVEEVVKGLRDLKQASLAFILIYVALIIGFIIAAAIIVAFSVRALTGVDPSQEEIARAGEEAVRRLLSAALIMSFINIGASLAVVIASPMHAVRTPILPTSVRAEAAAPRAFSRAISPPGSSSKPLCTSLATSSHLSDERAEKPMIVETAETANPETIPKPASL